MNVIGEPVDEAGPIQVDTYSQFTESPVARGPGRERPGL